MSKDLRAATSVAHLNDDLHPTPVPTPAPVERHADEHPHATFLLGEHGRIEFRLRPDAAPKTVANFVRLIEHGWYNGSTLYRFEAGFCLQGGGWPTKGSPFPSVPLEYKLPNRKYAVSMVRTQDPNSATGEFSIMLNDNSKWLGPGGSEKWGYAVFAEIAEGIDTIAKLGKLPTKKQGLTLFVKPVTITGAYVHEGLAPLSES